MPDDSDRELVERIRSALRERPEVVFAYLFGSRTRGGTHGASDVDVAVYLSEEGAGDDTGLGAPSGDGVTGGRTRRRTGRERLESWSKIHGDLVEALASAGDGVGLRHRGHAPEGVDLLILNDAPPLLSDRVIREGELLFSRSEPERVRWTVRQKSRYCDLRPLRQRLDETVSERLRKLDELVQRLGELGDMPRGEFVDDPRARAAAERLLQVAIQLCLDVGAHVLSDRGVVDWEEYREVPARLADEGVLPRELADRLARAAGQRNILVHLYLEVDPELVHDTLARDLDAFVAFAERIDRVLKEEGDAG